MYRTIHSSHLSAKTVTNPAVLFAALSTLLLFACSTPASPASRSEPTLAPAATSSSGPTDSADATMDQAVVRVGTIESVDGDELSLATVDGKIVATIIDDSSIQQFGVGTADDLAVGQRVTITGQGDETGIAAWSVVVSPANTSLFEDRGEFQAGRAMRGIIGTIQSIEGDTITVDTKVGLRTATINTDTEFQVLIAGSIEDISLGQLVTVTGTEAGDGSIAVQSILITPDLGVLMRGGRGGGRGGRGRGQGPDSLAAGAGDTPAETPNPVFDPLRQLGVYEGINFVVTETSEATFAVRERLALLPFPNKAVMRTNALSGDVHLDGRPSTVEIDLHQLSSDQTLRDGYVRRNMFPGHPTAVFTLQDLGPLPDGFASGEEVSTRVTGVLNIRGGEYPLSFEIEARDVGDAINIRGRTKFSWSDIEMEAPTVGLVLSLSDDVEVEINLTVKPVR